MTRYTEDAYKALLKRQKASELRDYPKAPNPPQKAQNKPVEAKTHHFPFLPDAIMEFRFAAPRKWRFDYAWPSHMVALEIEGGIWTGGRHTRGKGFLGDIEKYNNAALRGWRVFRATPDQLKSGEIITLLASVLV